MKAATLPAGLLSLFVIAHSLPAFAGWEVGDPKDIRIELRGFSLPGEPFRQTSVFNAPNQGFYEFQARSDLIAFGDVWRNDSPYLLVFYQSSTQFGYERLQDGIKAFDFLKRARIAYQGEEHTVASRIGTVNYLLFTATDATTGLDRGCAYWAGFFDGNRLVYKGLYCPAKGPATDEDARSAANAVALKSGN